MERESFARIASAVVNMSLSSLLEESRANPTLVTIEATVATGFEAVAVEECREKISKTINTALARGRVFFNVPIHKMNIVEELRSVDNLYVVMKMVPSLHLSCIDIIHDMNILQRELDHGDIKKALALWCERNKFQGIMYPTEDDYKVAKCDEVEIKKLAKTVAETQIGNKKYQTVGIYDENYENETCSLVGDNKDERARFNAALLEAYHETDLRKPEDKVLKFRVTCIRNGTHCFGSQDAAYHVGGRFQDMFHWIVDLNFYDLEIMLNIREDSMYYGIALTKESKHHRNINFFGPTTLRATICYNMLHLAQPKASDIIIDPMCGGGSIPIEGSLAFQNSYFICGDIHEKAVNRTQSNLDHLDCDAQRNHVDVFYWDATHLLLQDSSVDIFITDLPFGKRSGSVFDNRTLYKKVLLELARVVRCKTGRAVLLTYDRKSMTVALTFTAGLWKLSKKLKINIGGLEASVYVLWRLKASAAALMPFVPKKRHPKQVRGSVLFSKKMLGKGPQNVLDEEAGET